MSLAAAWILFPGVLLLLATGCGLLVERFLRYRLPGALVPATGLCVIVVCGELLTLDASTAELTVPVTALLALAGLWLGRRGALSRLDGWALVAALSAFAVFAAPIVLSGGATFAGYIKLDDTATWMALTDRVMDAGRSLDGLAPSTYEATLTLNLGDGYPIGAVIPLGVAGALSGGDVAWTIQPYMAALGAVLALGLWQLAEPLIASRPVRALAAPAGAVSALLFGYYLWGGVKEIAAAALLATIAAMAAFAIERRGELRALVPLALACAAEVAVLSAGGAIWLPAPLGAALGLVIARVGRRVALRAAASFAAIAAALSLPAVVGGGLLPPTSSSLTSAQARGNLVQPLDPAQLAGIWPAGDFRLRPEGMTGTYLLIALTVALAAVALVLASRRREWGLPIYVGGTLAGCAVISALGSPWVDGKALAIASPAIPLAAVAGAAAIHASGHRLGGALALAAVAGGVLWSNVLQYGDANLAPRDQLAELERAGGLIDGRGPTLLTEYQPYGARHFLRDADPEAASELRRRRVPLGGGGTLAKGEYADTDRLRLDGLLAYRTLVVRRGPDQSRPPSPYALAWSGEYYEVWERREARAHRVARHLGLGSEASPVGEPRCAEVRRLAALAGPEGTLLAATRPGVAVASLAEASYPASWATPETADRPVPTGAGDLVARLHVSDPGEYEVWLGGSVRPDVALAVDGRRAGEVRHQLNNEGLFVRLGEASLGPGVHEVTVRFGGADLHPGSGGSGYPIGPLVLSRSDASRTRVARVPASVAPRRLCGRPWDWIEAVRGVRA